MSKAMNTKSRRPYMAQIPSDELVTAQHDLTNGAYKLLMYYYSKGVKWEWKDEVMSIDLGISERMLKEYRNELISTEYLFIAKGKTIDNYFIGRQAVMDWKQPDEFDSNTGEIL